MRRLDGNATPDAGRIREWFERWRGANLGVTTGARISIKDSQRCSQDCLEVEDMT